MITSRAMRQLNHLQYIGSNASDHTARGVRHNAASGPHFEHMVSIKVITPRARAATDAVDYRRRPSLAIVPLVSGPLKRADNM